MTYSSVWKELFPFFGLCTICFLFLSFIIWCVYFNINNSEIELLQYEYIYSTYETGDNHQKEFIINLLSDRKITVGELKTLQLYNKNRDISIYKNRMLKVYAEEEND